MIDDDFCKLLGAAIRNERRKRKMTKTELHFKTRVCYKQLQFIEQGKAAMRLDTLLSICEALRMKPSELLAMVEES